MVHKTAGVLVVVIYSKISAKLDGREKSISASAFSLQSFIDLYSGIGITSIAFAKQSKKVISIEEVKSSVDNAKIISRLNNVKNIDILLGKCEDVIGNLNLEETNDLVVFVDPARLGLDSKVIDALKILNPRIIVYMSCNPETCVSDCKEILKDKKYCVSDIKLGDMFPFTKHIESLICIQNKESKVWMKEKWWS